jgi:hypothetical protein
MGILLFREEQHVSQTFIPLLMIPAWLISAGVFGWGFNEQLVKGKPWGDNPMSDTGLLITGIAVIAGLGILVSLLFAGSLITEVRSDGFYYRFSPFINKLRRIPIEQIASVEVKKYSPLLEYGGWGVRRSPFRRTTAYNISGNIGVLITLKTGRRFMFGTLRLEDMRRAVDKMLAWGEIQ